MGASSEEGFQLDQTFFILKAEYKKQIHQEIFNLVWVGAGRWDWNTVYNWPVWLRRFYSKQLMDMQSNKQSSAPTSNRVKETGTKPPF